MWLVLEKTGVKLNGKKAGRDRAALSDFSAELAFEAGGRKGRWLEAFSLQCSLKGMVRRNRHKMEPRNRQSEYFRVFRKQPSSAWLPAQPLLSMAAGPGVHLTDLQLLEAWTASAAALDSGVVLCRGHAPHHPHSCAWPTTGPAAMLGKAGSRRLHD